MKTIIKLAALITTFTAAALGQGALTPLGTPSPTMKSLDQIEPRVVIQTLPFIISAPGSYVLGRNLSGAEGITIASSNVTLDLNGFVLTGSAGNNGNGVLVAGTFERLVVRNGVLRDWGANGVAAPACIGAVIEKVQVGVDATVSNAFTAGISVGESSQVIACSVVVTGGQAGGAGILAASRSVFRDCIVTGIAGVGMNGGNGLTVVGCRVSGCLYSGVDCSLGAVIRDCDASSNGGNGFYVSGKATITGCAATSNGGGWLLYWRRHRDHELHCDHEHRKRILPPTG